MSGGFFRGTSADQDTRFSNKQAKLLKTQKFPAELDQLVDTTKVKMDVIRPWIATRVTELLGFEDEVLINFIYGLLDGKEVNGKEVQIQLTGFMEKNTVKFMKELWILLLSAQKNASGVPQQFLDAKEEEIRKKKAETDFLANEIQKKREKENREIEELRSKNMDDGAEKVSNSVLEPTSKNVRSRAMRNHPEDEEVAEKRNGVRGRSSDRHKSRSVSRSPQRRRRSFSRGRLSISPRRRDCRDSFSPRRRTSHSRRRSRSTSHGKSLSPAGRQLRSPSQHSSPSPHRKSPYRSSSPVQRLSSSPAHRRSPSLDKHNRSPSPTGYRRSLSPIRRRRSPSPVRRRRSPSPKWRRRSPSPEWRRRSPSPGRRRRSPSPGRRRRSPSSGRRRKSPSPVRRRRSPSPMRRRRSPSPIRRRRSPSPPRRHRSPSPHRRKSPSFVRRRRSPSPSHRRRSPSPMRYRRSPSPIKGIKSRSPVRRPMSSSPSPARKLDRSSPLDHRRTPSPLERRSPSTSLSKSPPLPQRSSPGRRKRSSPSQHSHKSTYDRSYSSEEQGNPSPVKVKTAQHQRRSLSQSPVDRSRNVQTAPASQLPSRSLRSPERDAREWNSNNRIRASSSSLEKSPPPANSPPATRSASDDRRLSSPRSRAKQHRRDNHSTRAEEEEATYTREGGNLESRSSLRKSLNSSIVGKMKDSSVDVKVASPGSDKHPQREAPGSLDRQKSSSSHKEPSLVEEQQPSYSRENDEKSYSRCSKAKETESLTVEDNSNRGEVSDSDLEEGYKRKTGSKEKKRHRKSDRRDTSSDSEDSYDTELERKETRRRKKEERRLRKEKKRQKREERRRKKEERRAEKTKAKNLSDDYSDDDRVAKEESYPSDAADEAEHRRLEIELRKKALESFNADSLSLLLPTSFPSISKSDSPSSSLPTKFGPFSDSSNRSFRFPKRFRLFRCQIPGSSSSSSNQLRDDASPELFFQNNSIADFMRFKRDGRTAELQTAIVSYKKKFPWSVLQPFLQVDLVSTIHIADKDYFEALQKELESYDCILYEMVASRESLENRRNPVATKKLKSSRSRGLNILGCIQRQMARVLTLDFQLDCLDYQAANWYHADLDYETFRILQTEKGENFFTFARDMTIRSTKAMVQPAAVPEDLEPWKSKLLWASRVLPMPLVGLLIIGSVCADGGSQASEFPEFEALSRLDLGAAMKVFLAKRLTSEFTQVTAEVEESSVIIGERNKAATEALRDALDKGHNRIAILYGGGHMPDLGRRLREEFDLIPCRVKWITAWSITKRKLASSSLPFLKALADVSGWPLNRYQTLALLIFSSVLAVDLWFWELFFGTAANWISEVALEVYQYIDNVQLM